MCYFNCCNFFLNELILSHIIQVEEWKNLLTSLNRRIQKEGNQMPFTSKIAKSIQSLTSTSHSRPSYSFLAAEERKLMLRQQQAIKIFEPVPNSMGWKKFGSWICQCIPHCYSHQGRQTTLMRILDLHSTSSSYSSPFSKKHQKPLQNELRDRLGSSASRSWWAATNSASFVSVLNWSSRRISFESGVGRMAPCWNPIRILSVNCSVNWTKKSTLTRAKLNWLSEKHCTLPRSTNLLTGSTFV